MDIEPWCGRVGSVGELRDSATERGGWCACWGYVRGACGPTGFTGVGGRGGAAAVDVAIDVAESGFQIPVAYAHEEVDAGATTTGAMFAAALIAEPPAVPVVVVPAEAIVAATGGAGLVFVGELFGFDATDSAKDFRPPPGGGVEG